jgi:hypothetical protein
MSNLLNDAEAYRSLQGRIDAPIYAKLAPALDKAFADFNMRRSNGVEGRGAEPEIIAFKGAIIALLDAI